MLIYEKKVEDERKLFGTLDNIPKDTDEPLTYTDQDNETVTPSLDYTYLDDGHGGIIMKDGNNETPLNVFIGDTQVIPTMLCEYIELSGDVKTEYQAGDKLDLTGLIVSAYYKDGRIESPVVGYTTTPDTDTFLTTEDTEVIVSYQGKTTSYTIEVEASLHLQDEA